MKRVLILLMSLVIVFSLVACGNNKNDTQTEITEETKVKAELETSVETTGETKKEGEKIVLNQINGYQEGNIKATMHTTMGDIKFILFPNVAPKAVENFVTHAKNGYYEGITFHRVIEGFMIQGGDPTGTGAGGESIWGSDFEDEFSVEYRNFYGALSMANAGPGTNGSQFFIVTTKDNVSKNLASQMRELGAEKGYPEEVVKAYEELGGAYHLDGGHTVFGHVVEGIEVAEAISKVETGANDKPVEDVKITSITIEK